MNGNKNNFVIFGGTGDLSYRKLLPALYNLYASNTYNDINIIAIGRREYTKEEYINIIKTWTKKYSRIEYNEDVFNEFTNNITYVKLDFTNKDEYHLINQYVNATEITENIYYFAVAPRFFNVIGEGLSTLSGDKVSKVVIEKPFGETLEEANRLNENLEKWFTKENIYHIDHYLGKEMIQNLLSVRFSNPIFKNSWNKESIECIQIIASEEEGVGTRAGYYDQSGALKDMVQNHLMQILSIVAMEEANDGENIKDKQVEVLKSLKKVEDLDIENHMLLGQYEGYKTEENVSDNSITETLALCKFYIDNKRWDGVPFYILTGKKLETRELNVIITFKSIGENEPNVLTFKIQPLEGLSLSFNVKKPGTIEDNINVCMDFYQEEIPSYQINTPEAYERLFISIIENDHTWFANWDQICTSWTYIESLKAKYTENKLGLISYDKTIKNLDIINKILDKSNHNWTTSQLKCDIQEKRD